jgi:hypothetical protein
MTLDAPSLEALAADAHAGFHARGGGAKRIAARAALARALWSPDGTRRLPTRDALDAALHGVTPADLAWVCEFAPLGPLYLLPTVEGVGALAAQVRALGVTRVLEVAAGDGFLAQCLRAEGLDVTATDSGRWADPRARMNPAEAETLAGVAVPGIRAGAGVETRDALEAIALYKPALVLAAWLPPDDLLEQLIRAEVPYVLEIGASDGATPGAWTWRFAHDFWEGPEATDLRCRLDARPRKHTHTRVTLYFGAAHDEHFEERPKRGDWLWQFRPVATRIPRKATTR